MLTSITVYDALGTRTIDLPVAGSNSASPYIVTDIDGLGPVAADVTTSSYAGQDGTLLQATRVGMRNLVIRVGYRPDFLSDQSAGALRRALYGMFPPKGEVRLRFRDPEFQIVDINGVVEVHEPVIFSREPEVAITILCTDPYFRAITSTVLNGFNNLPVLPSYFGTAGTDFLFEMFINRNVSMVTLENSLNEDIVYSGALVAGDVLSISTRRGNKFIRRTRDGSTTSVLDGLVRGYLSMALDSRTAEFYARVSGANTIPYRLTFVPKFGGI